ncbi:MAG: thiamine phosphate synthase [Phycisphaerae bacterium]|nr:thiamine phosphate synthase [Phycisphaerae bacterium]
MYVIVTEKLCRRAWQEVVEAAIAGGADCVQLREKELCGAELLIRARQLVQMCRRHGVLSIINDRPDIALLSGADGVHVGQDDLPAAEARKIIGHHRIVGVSTHDLSQAQAAERDGADYIGVGPVFHSTTKPRPILPGLEFARAAASQVKIPSVAIAGINPDNLRQVLETGIRAVAISSAILASDDPADLTRKIKNQMLAAEQTIRSA